MLPLPKLLIIDGNPARRAIVLRATLALGVDVEAADCLDEGLIAAQQGPQAAIVFGLGGDDAAEWQTLRQLTATDGAPRQPCIVIGAAESLRAPAHAAGATDFLTAAEIDSGVLLRKLGLYVELYRQLHELQGVLMRIRDESDHLFRLNEHLQAAGTAALKSFTHDRLTGLPNRELFEDRVTAALRRSERGRKCFAIARVTLCDAPRVEAEAGGAALDALRVAASNRLENAVRASDTVARIGPEEYAVLIEAIDSPRRAQALGRKLVDAIGSPLRLAAQADGRPYLLAPQAVAGLAVYPDDALDLEGLDMLAGLAQANALAQGPASVCVYGDAAASLVQASVQPDLDSRKAG